MSEWGHGGRPKKSDRVKPYTKSELRVARDEREGFRMLASAVLKQWVADGKPNDIPEAWVKVLKELS